MDGAIYYNNLIIENYKKTRSSQLSTFLFYQTENTSLIVEYFEKNIIHN